MKLKKISANIKRHAEQLAHSGFKQIFDRIDQLGIKKGVDTMGIDKFTEQCAYLAAGSGVVAGSGGLITMAIGLPLDMVNLITQQFRVTMATMYYTRGNYNFTFEEFMAMVATSLKVEAGVALTKTMMEGVAEKLLLMFGTRTAQRLVPVIGGVIGGTTNYLFIKRMAKQVREQQAEPVIQVS